MSAKTPGADAGPARFSFSEDRWIRRPRDQGTWLSSKDVLDGVTDCSVVSEWTLRIEDEIQPRQFILDRPFLLALTEQGASQPYLVLWVANPEVMEPIGTR